eukprot:154249_1
MCGLRKAIWNDNKTKIEDADYTNLLQAKIFDVFKNTQTLIIMTTYYTGYYCYPFAFSSLLLLIEPTTVEKVIVKAVVDNSSYNEHKNTWLSVLWSLYSSQIKQEYQVKRYIVTFKRITNASGRDEDWLKILKKQK